MGSIILKADPQLAFAPDLFTKWAVACYQTDRKEKCQVLGLCRAVPPVTSGACLHTVMWWGKRPLCVLCEISGDTALIVGINVIRTGVDLGDCSLHGSVGAVPKGSLWESDWKPSCLPIKSIWSTYFMYGSHGLHRACPAVAGSAGLGRSIAGISWGTTVHQWTNQLPSQACTSHQ